MKLGIMVTTDRHLTHLAGITRAAVARGHEVVIFNTDEGVRLIRDPEYQCLGELPGVRMSFCDLMTDRHGVSKEGLPELCRQGNQYDNSTMAHNAQRVINL
jgi:peroxiredoxin family protein